MSQEAPGSLPGGGEAWVHPDRPVSLARVCAHGLLGQDTGREAKPGYGLVLPAPPSVKRE